MISHMSLILVTLLSGIIQENGGIEVESLGVYPGKIGVTTREASYFKPVKDHKMEEVTDTANVKKFKNVKTDTGHFQMTDMPTARSKQGTERSITPLKKRPH